jgi:arginine:ornithine antiporter/lysine permease
VPVFVFIGIEGASAYSRYARERSDVGAATATRFVGVTALTVLVTLPRFAVLAGREIARMRRPSMAGVLEAVVGPWDAIFISADLLVSVPRAYLAWSLIGGLSTAEFPKELGGEMLALVKDAAGVTEYLLPPLPNTLCTCDTTCWIYGGVTLNPLY